MLRMFSILIMALVFVYASVWVYNFVHPWLGILMPLVAMGIILYRIDKNFKD